MYLRSLLIVFVLLPLGVCAASEATYQISPENTTVKWTGTKSNGKHEGGFKKFSGVARLVEGEGLSLEMKFECSSIYSDNFLLTQHLKSGDFFSVRTHPTASFKSTRIDQNEKGFVITGVFKLLDKSKEISFPATIEAGEKLVLNAEFSFNRREFGMHGGDGKVDDIVQVEVAVIANQ